MYIRTCIRNFFAIVSEFIMVGCSYHTKKRVNMTLHLQKITTKNCNNFNKLLFKRKEKLHLVCNTLLAMKKSQKKKNFFFIKLLLAYALHNFFYFQT